MKITQEFTKGKNTQYEKAAFVCYIEEQTIHLIQNEISLELIEVLKKNGRTSSMVITAHNPFGCICEQEENVRLNRILEDKLDGYLSYKAVGGSEEHYEDGFLVMVDSYEEQVFLMNLFRQDAILRINLDGVPRLVYR